MRDSGVDARAVVAPGVLLPQGVEVGPYAVIRGAVRLDAGVVIAAHTVIDGTVWVGRGARLGPYACVGQPAQDRLADPQAGGVEIGAGAVVREFATVHRGASRGGVESWTRLGAGVYVMTQAHIAHDCAVGPGVTVANGAMLGGHVRVGAGAMISARAMVHQHVRVGRLAFVAGAALVERDVPPFCRVDGNRAALVGLNVLGLRRAGCDAVALEALRVAYGQLFRCSRPLAESCAALAAQPQHPWVAELVDFIGTSCRGICR